MKNSKALLLLTLFTISGVLLRLYLAVTTDIWFDEAFSGLAVSQDWAYLWQTLQQDGLHPPLMYVLQKLSVDLLGNSIVALRLPSLISGALLIVIVYALVKKAVKDVKPALISAGLVAFSPFMVLYSLEARPYMLLALLGVSWSYFIYRQIHEKKNSWIFLVLFSALMLATHLFSVFWLAAGWLYVIGMLVWRRLPKDSDKKIVSWLQKHWLWLIPAAAICFLLLNQISFLFEKIIARSFGWLPSSTTLQSILRLLYSYMFGVDAQAMGFSPCFPNALGIEAGIIAALVVVFVLVSVLRKRQEPLTYFATFMAFAPITFGFVLSSITVDLLLPRYFLLSAPFFLILLATQISKLKAFNLYFILGIFVVFTITLNFASANQNYAEIAKEIHEQGDNYELVVINDPAHFVVLKYYALVNGTEAILVMSRDLWGQNWATIDNSEVQLDLDLTSPKYLVIDDQYWR